MLRVWYWWGTSCVFLGLVIFLLSPAIRVVVGETYFYIFTPSVGLILVVIGVLVRLEWVLRNILTVLNSVGPDEE